MDKRQFLEELINTIRNYSITSIIGSRIHLVRSGMYHKGLCPFHADRTIGSFVVTENKGLWKCFSCGDGYGGDAIKFISLYENINYVESAFKLGLELGIINLNEYETYFKKKKYRKREIILIQKKYEKIDNEKYKEDRASDDVLDVVFNTFAECCELKEEHYKQLKDCRKISEERIKEYFTFPTRRILKTFISKLEEKGYKEDILKKVPGFYYSKKEQRMLFDNYKGLCIKIKNAKGETVGIQIRKDHTKDKEMRYIWFSTGYINLKESQDVCDGTTAGSPLDVVYPKEIKMPIIAITEGRFKAEKLAELGFISISVQGVGSWKHILKEINYIKQLPIYQYVSNKFITYFNKKNGINKIPFYICFDADMKYNYQVFNQAKKMSDMLEGKLPDYYSLYIHWDDELGKGIDDLINNGYINNIKKIEKKSMDETVNKIVKTILENETYDKIQKVPKEVFKKYFNQYSTCLKVSGF